MSTWSNNELIQWLKTNGFKKYTRKFQEQEIDGHRFLRLTDEEIIQFLTRTNDDGTEERPTIGIQIRFRTKLNRLKQIDVEEKQKISNNIIQATEIHSHEEEKQRATNEIRQYNYAVTNDDDHYQFFEKPKFINYLLDYLKKETHQTNIEIIKNLSDYTIQIIGTKKEIRSVRKFLRNVFQSIQSKEYQYSIMKHWLLCPAVNKIIQHLFDSQTSLWIVCEFFGTIKPTLKITFFNDEKFNGISPIPLIDQIVEKEISMERIFISGHQSTRLIEYFNLTTMKLIHNEIICFTQSYEDEYRQILESYQQKQYSLLISIVEKPFKDKLVINIFGDTKLVTKVLKELEDLFKKHRRQKFSFIQLSKIEIDCLFQLHRKELKQMESERNNFWVEFDWNKSFFYAPDYAKDQIESQMKQLFIELQQQKIKTEEFYYENYSQIESHIKTLSGKYQCYSIIKRNTKLKSFSMIKDHLSLTGDSLSLPSMVICQATFPNGTIEVLIDDVAQQQTDVMIIPTFYSGLREYLIQCAGNIEEINHNDQLPFITETTVGNLKCQTILFINWSLPKQKTSEEYLIQTIQFFLSKIFKYLIKHEKKSNVTVRSITIVMPEIFDDEDIFFEEFLNELINQIHSIKSLSFRVTLLFLPDQQKFYHKFIDVLQLYQNTGNTFGIFYCPTTTLSITLLSLSIEKLDKCQKILNAYLKRSMCTKELNGFDHWNQHIISQFYSFAQQRSVLPKMNKQQQQQVILYGHIIDVEQVYHQYQLINVSIRIRRKFPEKTAYPNIMLHYSSKDSKIGERLFNRLTNDGFQVVLPLDSSKENLIIFCISNQSLDDDQFRELLIAENESGKKLIPLQIEPYQTTRWLRELIGNQCIFRLFGSDEYFNLQYQKLILKILSEIEQNDADLLKTMKNDPLLHFLLTFEQRKSIYEKNIKEMVHAKKSRFPAEERKNLLSLIESTIDNTDEFPQRCLHSFFSDQFVKESDDQQRLDTLVERIRDEINHSSLTKWIDQFLKQSTKQNLPPFSPTGDFNDAAFQSSIMIPSKIPLHSLFGVQFWSLYRIEESEKRDHTSDKKQLSIRQSTEIKQYKSNPRSRTSSHVDRTLGTLSSTHTHSALIKANRPERQKSQLIKSSPALPRLDTAARNARRQHMVENLQKGFEEFQHLCAEYQPRRKGLVQKNIKAIFTSSPFNNTNIQYRKALKTRPNVHLPLKFLWNDVSEIDERKSKRNDASVLFFFEPTLASEKQ